MGALTPETEQRAPLVRIAVILMTIAVTVMPPLGVVAPKGEALLLALAALMSLPLRDWRAGTWYQDLRRPGLLYLLIGALLAWGLVRLPETNTQGAFFTWLRTMGVMLAGAVLIGNLRLRKFPEIWRLSLPGGVLIAVAMMAAHLVTVRFFGRPLWGNPWWVDEIAPIRSGAAMAAVLIWPAGLLLWRHGWRKRLVLAAVICLPVIASSGDSPTLALVGGAVGFAAIFLGGRMAAMAIAAIAIAMVLSMATVNGIPAVRDTVAGHPPEHLAGSAEHRLIIWSFVADRIDERPWLGWGFDSSRSIPGANKQPAFGSEYLPLHPHNAALQERLELGVPGVILYAGLLGVLLVGGSCRRDPVQASRTAMVIGYAVVGNLSYGVWQSWWVATAWLAAATWIAVADQTRISR